MIARALIALLRGYKRYISPHLGHHCRFVPTCSEYAMQALATHGLLKGLLLARLILDRVVDVHEHAHARARNALIVAS